MPIGRIEKIKSGVVVQKAEPHSKDGHFWCHTYGSNIDPIRLSSLDEVAEYLRDNPKSGVRMNPGWSKISEDIFIDGAAR